MSENMSLLGMYLMKNRGRFIAIYKHASSTHWVKPTFYLAPQLSSTYRANNIDSSRTEVVIIINPPSNEDSLLKYINLYNQDMLNNKYSIQNQYTLFERDFYRESKKTPRNFIDDGGGFYSDRLEDHKEDWIASWVMDEECNGCPKVWKFYKNKDFLKE
jgi:hypothetical protein